MIFYQSAAFHQNMTGYIIMMDWKCLFVLVTLLFFDLLFLSNSCYLMVLLQSIWLFDQPDKTPWFQWQMSPIIEIWGQMSEFHCLKILKHLSHLYCG